MRTGHLQWQENRRRATRWRVRVAAMVALAVPLTCVVALWTSRRPAVASLPTLTAPDVARAARAPIPTPWPPPEQPIETEAEVVLPPRPAAAAALAQGMTPLPALPRLALARGGGPGVPVAATGTVPDGCVAFGWGASVSGSAPGLVLVEVVAENRCRTTIPPRDVAFDVAGFAGGAAVESVRGYIGEALRQGRRVRTVIGLPGTLERFDEIRVRLARPGAAPKG